MKPLKEYRVAFREGRRVHQTAYGIIHKYAEPCKEASEELRDAGITLDQWRRLQFGTDNSLTGIVYSLGAFVSWFKSGTPQ